MYISILDTPMLEKDQLQKQLINWSNCADLPGYGCKWPSIDFPAPMNYFLEICRRRLIQILSLSISLIEIVIVQKPARSTENVYMEDVVVELFIK